VIKISNSFHINNSRLISNLATVLITVMNYFFKNAISNCKLKYCTVKHFNLVARKVDDFACKIILAPFILANSSRTIPTQFMSNAN